MSTTLSRDPKPLTLNLHPSTLLSSIPSPKFNTLGHTPYSSCYHNWVIWAIGVTINKTPSRTVIVIKRGMT